MTSKTDTQLARIEEMLARIEALEEGHTLPSPNPLVMDAYGNPSVVAPGDLIESAWGNAVKDRVVLRFPDKAALNTATPPHGTFAVTTADATVWFRNASTWVPTAVGNRVAFRCVGLSGGQNVAPGTLSTLQWTTVSNPGGGMGALTFIVPAGWGGRWTFEWDVAFPDGAQNGARLVFCDVPSVGRLGEQNSQALEGGTLMSGSGSLILTAGAEVGITVYHTDSSGVLLVNSTGHPYFQGHFAGPF